jgi:GTP cyclohydrolase II
MEDCRVPAAVPAAAVRRQIRLPLRFGDGLVVEASVFTFDGLCDGGEHVAFGPGDLPVHRSDGPKAVPLVRLHV